MYVANVYDLLKFFSKMRGVYDPLTDVELIGINLVYIEWLPVIITTEI